MDVRQPPVAQAFPAGPAPEIDEGAHVVQGWIRSRFENEWAACRPPAHRTPPIRPGDTVLYRMNEFGPEVPALILDLFTDRDEDRADPMIWRQDNSGLVDDPWWWVALKVDPEAIPPSWTRIQREMALHRACLTREARQRGSAGYLHPLWACYPQPVVGATHYGSTWDEISRLPIEDRIIAVKASGRGMN